MNRQEKDRFCEVAPHEIARLRAEVAMLRDALRSHNDRCADLAQIVRRLARLDPIDQAVNLCPDDYCHYCYTKTADHYPDCLWRKAQELIGADS